MVDCSVVGGGGVGCGGVGIEDLHGVVASGAEGRTVIGSKFRV